MKIDGSGNLARELRQLAGDVHIRRDLEESEFDRTRLANLGELLLIAADMAADLDGISTSSDYPSEVVDEWFDDIVYREFPDGTEGQSG
ncbi:hypothetical protein [Jatrophihabitans endophyticus]|uniref:hypothetical protein n=1 Tax=Jatrophihabitans endophyticus TaxID=1206085 RepID=UPI00116151A1|nr:hypothetical protein [Jatrophihabitans endophyticus]